MQRSNLSWWLLYLVATAALIAAAGASAAMAPVAAAKGKLNIVYIMADDLNADWKNDRLDYMPNLKKHFKDGGTYFENHVAAQPVCGPSRSSMLLGRYPHNTGYKANSDDQSTANYLRQHNDTVGNWLKKAGYYTAFFGKYVNGCEGSVPSGWSYWGALSNTYDFYNATIWEMDWEAASPVAPTKRVMTDVHQADFLGNFTIEHATKATKANRPFFISVTPVMPHWGTCYGPGPDSVYPPYDPHWEWTLPGGLSMPVSPCPTNRNRHRFDAKSNPRIPGVWNVSITGNRPVSMKQKFEDVPGALTEQQAYREDIGWQNRSASLIDLDEMIGVIMTGLVELSVLDNTIVFFTSDNGYHLGEHKMPFGKGQPYDTDVRLPMYVRGPGVVQGRVLPHPTNHLDITATIVDMAGARAAAPADLDGLSFWSSLGDVSKPPAALGDAWRQHSFSEFFAGTDTWQLVRVVNSTHTFSYAWWCTNDTEVFDLAEDPWQKANLDGNPGLPQRYADEAGRLVLALGSCSGSDCSAPTPAASPPADGTLECYKTVNAATSYLGSFSIHTAAADAGDQGAGKPARMSLTGWLADVNPMTPESRGGKAEVTVMLRVDGKFYGSGGPVLPFVLANVSRPDILPSYPAIPDPNHGFVIAASEVPAELLKGNHVIELYGKIGATGQVHGYGYAGKGTKQQGRRVCLCDGRSCPCKSDPDYEYGGYGAAPSLQ